MSGALTIETAPVADDNDDRDCPICADGGCYVRYDGDTVCRECGHVAGSRKSSSDGQTPWSAWWDHRSDEYDGKTGDSRIRMVGGFVSAYEY
jgi:hypothetical protein